MEKVSDYVRRFSPGLLVCVQGVNPAPLVDDVHDNYYLGDLGHVPDFLLDMTVLYHVHPVGQPFFICIPCFTR